MMLQPLIGKQGHLHAICQNGISRGTARLGQDRGFRVGRVTFRGQQVVVMHAFREGGGPGLERGAFDRSAM